MKIKKKKAAPAPAPRAVQAETPAETPEAQSGRRGRSQYKEVNRVVSVQMIPYLFWKEWGKAIERNDYQFVWDMTAVDSVLREQFGPRDEFSETCRRKLRPLPGFQDAELRRIRLDGADEAHVLQVYGVKERERSDYTAERWHMLRGPAGWRVHRIDEVVFPKTRPVTELSVDDFPAAEHPTWFAPLRDEREAERVAVRAKARAARAAAETAAAAAAAEPAAT